MDTERRQHRRQAIRFPLVCSVSAGTALGFESPQPLRGMTTDISPGGVAFEADLSSDFIPPATASTIDLELTIPPGDGHFPYPSCVSSVAEILRCIPLTKTQGAKNRQRFSIAARFCEPLKLDL